MGGRGENERERESKEESKWTEYSGKGTEMLLCARHSYCLQCFIQILHALTLIAGQVLSLWLDNSFTLTFSFQESKGYDFESETDTETIAKLVKYMFDNRESNDITFTTLVERVIQQLVNRKLLAIACLIYLKGLPTFPASSCQKQVRVFFIIRDFLGLVFPVDQNASSHSCHSGQRKASLNFSVKPSPNRKTG